MTRDPLSDLIIIIKDGSHNQFFVGTDPVGVRTPQKIGSGVF